MSLPAIKNPRKAFNFIITFTGLANIPPFGVQECTLPDSDIEEVLHGFGNTELKTAGIVKTGTLKIGRIISLDPASILANENEEIFLWHMRAQNAYSQVGGDPDAYKRAVIIEELDNSGFGLGVPTVVATYTCLGAWPRLINGRSYKRGESANVMENVEFAVDYLIPGVPGN